MHAWLTCRSWPGEKKMTVERWANRGEVGGSKPGGAGAPVWGGGAAAPLLPVLLPPRPWLRQAERLELSMQMALGATEEQGPPRTQPPAALAPEGGEHPCHPCHGLQPS
jgi:hypothetical protein